MVDLESAIQEVGAPAGLLPHPLWGGGGGGGGGQNSHHGLGC